MAQQQTDTLAVELIVDDTKATVKLDNFNQKIKLVNDDINSVGGDKKFAEKVSTDLVELSRRADAVHKSFQDVAKARLDGGQIGAFTKEIVAAQERSRQLSSDIVNLRKELANPNRKSSIAFLSDELRAAEREADQLNRKLSALPSQSSASAIKSSGRRRGLSEFQRAGLEIADDFAPPGLNRPFNAVAKELLLINTLSATTLLTFGAIAAVGFGIVKVTQNIREESERRLKVEESIATAGNKQIFAQQQAIKNLKELRENNSFDRQFSQQNQTSSIEELKARRETLEKLYSLSPKSETADRTKDQILALDAQIYQTQQQNQKKASDSFAQHWERWKKLQEDAAKTEQRQAEVAAEKAKAALEKRNADIKKATEKVAELGKQYNSVFDTLFAHTNKENPFVSIFGEGDKALKILRENLRGISPELEAVAVAMQQKLNDTALFGARLDSNLNAFDLRNQAATFRNYAPKPDADAEKKKFDERIRLAVEGSVVEKTFGGFFNNGRKVSDYTPEQQRDIFEKQVLGNAAPNNLEGTISYLARLRHSPKAIDENLSFQERLQKQIDIIDKAKLGATNQDEINNASRKIIALTSVDPSKLNDSQRLRAAEERERDAVRIQDGEREARAQRAELIKLQSQTAENGKRLVQIAERDGLKGIENVIRLIDARTDGKSELRKAPTAADVQKASDDAYTGGTFFGDYDKR